MMSSPSRAAIWEKLEALDNYREIGPGRAKASCPGPTHKHGDRTPSLSIGTKDDGKVVVFCHVGCDYEDIMAALEATWHDQWPDGMPPGEKRYQIKDRKGVTQDTHRRFYDRESGKKTMPWIKGTPRDTLPLYGSEKLKDLPSGSRVYLTEGESACEALWRRGLAAVGTVTGESGLPCDSSLGVLRKYHTVKWPDNDDGGREHMEKIGERLTAQRCEHSLLNWPDAPPKGDVDDYFAFGGTVEGLEKLLCDSANCEESEESPQNGDNSHNSQFAESHERAREDQDTPPAPKRTPPAAMDEAAYFGLAGEIVRAVLPHTEADPAGILVQLLTLFGACAGRSTYFQVSGTRHYPNLYVNLVGDTSVGRKGMAWGVAHYVFMQVRGMDAWLPPHILGGLSSGEGVIHALSDYHDDEGEGGKKRPPALPTQTDKRAIVYESEFSSVLKMPSRDGNTLSEILRLGWDGRDLQTLTKGAPERATGPHIAVIGNITPKDLARYLSETDRANGLGNRFLWIYVRRSKLLPDGGDLTAELLQPFADKLKRALDFAQGRINHVMTRDSEAGKLWHAEYARLADGYPDSMFGAMTARAVAQVMRMACIYALLDQSQVICVEHLKAALAVWTYAEDSVRFIFGDALGDPVADTILRALRTRPQGITRTEMIAELFSRHIKADVLSRALDLLRERQLARCEVRNDTGGRAEERWFATMASDDANTRSAKNAKKEAA